MRNEAKQGEKRREGRDKAKVKQDEIGMRIGEKERKWGEKRGKGPS